MSRECTCCRDMEMCDCTRTPAHLEEAVQRMILDAHDPVSKPSHYNKSGIELMDVLDAWDADRYQAAIVQYVLGWKEKGGVEDLKKCKWYLDRYIEGAPGLV